MSEKSAPGKPKSTPMDVGRLDMTSSETLKKFLLASAAYTSKAVKSKGSAIRTLQREGILTAKGNLTKIYTSR